MPRVTKAQLEQQLVDARFDREHAKEGTRIAQGMAVDFSIKAQNTQRKLAQLEDLYTRVRIAIGGGTGQEPWDIFEVIKAMKADQDYWFKRYAEKRDELWALQNPPTWRDRVTDRIDSAAAKVGAWVDRNAWAVFLWTYSIVLAAIWFTIGRASTQ